MKVSKRRLKKLILKAKELTIRKRPFVPNEIGKVIRLLKAELERLQKVMRRMHFESSFRIFFSLPYLLKVKNKTKPILSDQNESEASPPPDPKSDIAPKGSASKADLFLKDVVPVWTGKISNSWFDSKFSQLDKALSKVWIKFGEYLRNDSDDPESDTEALAALNNCKYNLPGVFNIVKDCKESDLVDLFNEQVNSVLKTYFTVLEFEKKSDTVEFNLHGSFHKVRPDFGFFDIEENLFFFMEMKRNGLSKYLDKDVIKHGEEMNSIMEQVLKYMVATRTDCCIISDLEVSILVQLDFGEEKTSSFQNSKVAIIPFKYHIFRPNDPIYTFQAIICSVAYDQKLRVNDPIQKANVERLEALMVHKCSQIRLTRSAGSSSGSNSQTNYSNSLGLYLNSPVQLPPIGEQDSDAEDMSDGYNPSNEKESWRQYKEMDFDLKDGEFEVLQRGGYYLTTVLKLNRAAIDRNLSYLKIPSSVSYVILKVFDLNTGDLYIEYNELRMSYEKIMELLEDKFVVEKACYDLTNAYNEARGAEKYLRVPKMYQPGGGYIRNGEKMISFGWFLVLEYIEKDQDQRFSLEEASSQVKVLGSLGIQHNDIHWRNIAVSKGKFNLIDFSEAKLNVFDLQEDLGNLKRVWVENLKLQDTENGSKNFRKGQSKGEPEQVEDIKSLGDSDKENHPTC